MTGNGKENNNKPQYTVYGVPAYYNHDRAEYGKDTQKPKQKLRSAH